MPRRRPGGLHFIRFATLLLSFAAFFSRGSAPAAADEGPTQSPYAPYRFLIGEWSIVPEGGGPALGIARLRWGPNQSYVWYSSSFLVDGRERPHFEGLLVWNGVHKNLDMLISMDLERGLVQEQGTVSVDPDGVVVREITATYSEGVRPLGQPAAGKPGTTARFRQTFQALGPDRVLTAALRDSGHGWMATFPGSDRLVMIRRPATAAQRTP
jgi:hypothetical protein